MGCSACAAKSPGKAPEDDVQAPQPRAPSSEALNAKLDEAPASAPSAPPQFMNETPSADAASVGCTDVGGTSNGGISGGEDDLGWATSAPPDASTEAAPPEWAVTAAAAARTGSPGEGPEGAGDAGVTVQINLEGTWRESSPEEVLQVCQHIANGEREFQIKARGQNYQIVLDGPEGAVQINTNSGKRRKMRILEKDADDDGGRESLATPASAPSGKSLGDASPEVLEQQGYGPQSKRGRASQHPMKVLMENPHAQECFLKFEANEAKMCGEWAVFYHSYSFAALIYEVHAAVGAVLFRFRSQFATLPRILVHEFNATPDANALMNKFNTKFATNKRDHHPEFRSVGLSVMCSLVSTGPEACVPMVFIAGYSCKDLSFRGVLEGVLQSCYVPKNKVKKLADDIIELSEKHGLDVSQFGGKPCKSGKAGHLLQIFMKRNLVDKLCYPAKPYGVPDNDRLPFSKLVDSNESMQVGQARIVAHPKYFLKASQVRCHVASADPDFHRNRAEFQKQLTALLNVILGDPSLRTKAATGIYGGTLPSWYNAEDQTKHLRTPSEKAR
mmetsp:Transcript_147484/g.268875  ORF Transcript_147484/g.268875 Transcript_147484/m.268875 type:complete len:559 (+) Transcript_147484:49-1725(+)